MATRHPSVVPAALLPSARPQYCGTAEKIWWRLEQAFTNKTFQTLEQLSEFLSHQVHAPDPVTVKYICAYHYLSNTIGLWSILEFELVLSPLT